MNRRNVLIALGAVAIMTGIVFGTGAFTQVEADRTVNVDVAEDADAFLAIEEGPGANADYVDTDDDGAIVVNLDGTNVDGDGLNPDAVTSIDDLITLTNQGTQEVGLRFELEVGGADDEGITLTFDETTLDVGDSTDGDLEIVTGDAGAESLPNDFDGDITLTIVADADDV